MVGYFHIFIDFNMTIIYIRALIVAISVGKTVFKQVINASKLSLANAGSAKPPPMFVHDVRASSKDAVPAFRK